MSADVRRSVTRNGSVMLDDNLEITKLKPVDVGAALRNLIFDRPRVLFIGGKPSASIQLNLWARSPQLDTGIGRAELPVDTPAAVIAILVPGGHT